jgi:hypothetical protein
MCKRNLYENPPLGRNHLVGKCNRHFSRLNDSVDMRAQIIKEQTIETVAADQDTLTYVRTRKILVRQIKCFLDVFVFLTSSYSRKLP